MKNTVMRQLCHNTYGNKKTTKLTLIFNGKYKQEKKNKYIFLMDASYVMRKKRNLKLKSSDCLNKRNELQTSCLYYRI